ncbi:MAG TPA: 4-hydroxybenzoate 3-monooxygenase [Pseudonocardiaceae bacterium]|nr:4-hydroxybenzoate 3-monooxygenase [Pseudonocardiaceae bacterium]
MVRTQVGIVGAGPAGLLLSHLLHLAGIDSVVLERSSKAHVQERIRAGVVEAPSAGLLREVGLGTRMDAEGLPHHGISLRFDGADHRIALTDLTGSTIVVYGQQEIVKDLIAAREAADAQLFFEVTDVAVHDATTDNPRLTFRDADGRPVELDCAIIAGCDGFHGVSRTAIPAERQRIYQRDYPFAWLGVLASTAPSHHELIYAHHEQGFALHSMRSPELTRLYLQVGPEEELSSWSDERIWAQLHTRLAADGFTLNEGPFVERSITAMRSFVLEPMRYGRLFLAGDAAHIVPPTGAKGMNLAIADVRLLAEAVIAFLTSGDERGLDSYGERCLNRVWRAEHFSWWMTSMLHQFPDNDDFQRKLQLSQLRYTVASTAAATSLAENYVGLPF